MISKLPLLALAAVVAVSSAAFAAQPVELMWDDMVPRTEVVQPKSALPGPDGGARGPDAESDDIAGLDDPYASWDFSRPVESLDGKFVKLPGFIVPLESDEGGLLSEFLLVPYYGACIHTPAPAPNQVVYISLEEPFNLTSMYDAYWITGTIKTERYSGMMADTVYRMDGQKVEKYEW